MIDWLNNSLQNARQNLTEESEAYLLGRGVREPSIRSLEFGLWRAPSDPLPNDGTDTTALFVERYGAYGQNLNDMLVYPLRTGKGDLLGFEGRTLVSGKKKFVTQFLLPRSGWNPVFVGLYRAMPKIWAGGSVWIVEGVFDATALEHIVPESDALLATLRARLSFEHVEFLRRFLSPTATVNMVYDEDETGRKAVEGYTDEKTGKWIRGAVESMKSVGIRCRDIRYRGGKDPCEIWENRGTSGLRDAFSSIL